MSYIPPYLTLISGGLSASNKTLRHNGHSPKSVPVANDSPTLVTLSGRQVAGSQVADQLLQQIKHSHLSPGELHSNLNARRALELLIP